MGSSHTLNRMIREAEAYHGGVTEAVTNSAANTFSGANTLSGNNTISGTTTHSGDLKVTGDLYAELYVEDHTTADTLTSAESGSVHTNAGATAAVALTLPSASAGQQFKFAVMAAQNLVPTAASGDKIYNGTATASTLTANAIGECIELVAVDATNWIVMDKEGTWS